MSLHLCDLCDHLLNISLIVSASGTLLYHLTNLTISSDSFDVLSVTLLSVFSTVCLYITSLH